MDSLPLSYLGSLELFWTERGLLFIQNTQIFKKKLFSKTTTSTKIIFLATLPNPNPLYALSFQQSSRCTAEAPQIFTEQGIYTLLLCATGEKTSLLPILSQLFGVVGQRKRLSVLWVTLNTSSPLANFPFNQKRRPPSENRQQHQLGFNDTVWGLFMVTFDLPGDNVFPYYESLLSKYICLKSESVN